MNRLRNRRVARDYKISDAFSTGRDQLWLQAGIPKLQVALFDLRQERFCTTRKFRNEQAIFFVIIFSFNISCGRADENGSPKRLGEMNAKAEAIRVRQRINKTIDQQGLRAADFAVFAANGIDAPRMISEERSNFIGKKPRGVDNAFRLDGFVLGIFFVADAEAHTNGFARRLQRNYLRARNNTRALVCCNASVGVNKFRRGEDARGRDLEGGDAFDIWFAGMNLDGADDAQPLDSVVFPSLFQRDEFRRLMRVGCDYQLSGVPMRDVVFGAEFVGEAIAFQAVARLERVFRIVDAGVDHAAVARAGSHPELGKLFDEEDILPALRHGASDSAPDDTSADDKNIRLVHVQERIKQKRPHREDFGDPFSAASLEVSTLDLRGPSEAIHYIDLIANIRSPRTLRQLHPPSNNNYSGFTSPPLALAAASF